MMQRVSPSEIVRSGLCIGCGTCAINDSRINMQFDVYGQLKPSGSLNALEARSTRLGMVCPFSPAAANEDTLTDELFRDSPFHNSSCGRYIKAYVGHASEVFRNDGSSGGLTTFLLTDLLRKKMIDAVAHVGPADFGETGRFFTYRISRTAKEIAAGAKSRYYPIEMSSVLNEIRRARGRYAVVGIPCFIKAIQLLRREDPIFRERITFTIGLFCGHMKSARFLESIALQMKVAPKEISEFDFRTKDPNKPANWYRAEIRAQGRLAFRKDWWHLVDGDWGAGFFMNSACNYCDDVVAETADVSVGDAWVEPYSSDWRGTNVVIVRSREIHRLIERATTEGDLSLTEVDGEFVGATQAAGLRQRREGLAYRTSRYRTTPIRAAKRGFCESESIPLKRRLVYRLRFLISLWSHRVYYLSRGVRMPSIYLAWARAAAYFYHAVTYHRGRIGQLFRWF